MNAGETQGISQISFGAVVQCVAAFGVDLTHAPDVTPEMAFGDELSEDGLIDGVGPEVGLETKSENLVHEAIGDDHVAEAEGGEENLVEAADEDDGAGFV